MASTYKVLGQLAPTAATLSTLYTVPAATQAVSSTLSICNTSSVSTTIRVAIRPIGAPIDVKHYIMYEAVVSGNDSLFLTIGAALATADVVSVYATLATISFTLFGSEIV